MNWPPWGPVSPATRVEGAVSTAETRQGTLGPEPLLRQATTRILPGDGQIATVAPDHPRRTDAVVAPEPPPQPMLIEMGLWTI